MKAIDIFADGIEKLLSSNFLTAGREIRAFLELLADDEELKAALASSSDGFRFEEELNRAFGEKNGLPKRNDRTVALITALLYAIDTGRIPLADFLSATYPDRDGAAAYSQFLTDCIMPYAECFVKLLIGEPEEEIRIPQNKIFDKLREDVAAIAERLCADALRQNENAQKIVDASDGLLYALTFNDALLARYAYDGLNNALRLYGIRSDFEKDLGNLLRLYGII